MKIVQKIHLKINLILIVLMYAKMEEFYIIKLHV